MMDKKLKQIELIIKYVKSELSRDEEKKIKKLLSSDKEFAKMYEIIKTLDIDSMSSNLAELAPPLKQMSLGMFREFQKTKKDKEIMRGLPVYDSRVLPIPEGVRPSETNSRRLKYKFDSMELELSLYPTSLYSYEMIGQLSGAEDSKYRIELTGKEFRRKTETDELQMFTFVKIPAMKYRLNILSGRKTIAVVDLEI
jgi:hypothetical protein